ncbi:hypothetical protein DBR40_22100 [Pedobacter sp. KBW01]|uniref:hypothetical protein n=1 Tax=Pedobacter sp. KBW01 TaxID=2153364 RepID=UPI000F59DD09|nr:hypothetical protein [Pedobacter sp. KBW01]RQO66576.1 hypothetical protein DBR40_22100 [Pedobacter sp. KBW01]
MKKIYCFIGLACIICLGFQTSHALQPGVQELFSKVDTARRIQKIKITVLDLASSKPLDSVQVTLGKESKYTVKGIVVFENNEDSVIVLSKPGYRRMGKKVLTPSLVVRMVNTERVEGYAVSSALLKASNDAFSPSAVVVTGEELRNISVLSLIDGLKFYLPSLLVSKSNNQGDNPNSIPGLSLSGTGNFPFWANTAGNNKDNTSSGLLTTPSVSDYIASNTIANSTPVILLDGIQVSLQTILDIDVNRVKSVTILKDALAMASYGMRGATGVIAIKTNKPSGKLEISFREQAQIASANISSFTPLTAKQKLEVEKNSGLFNGALAPVYQNRYNQAYANDVNTDWLSIPLRNALSTKHTLALSAGNDDMAYGLTGSYNNVNGTIKGTFRKNLDLGAYFGGHFGEFSFSNQFSYLGTDAANSPYGTFDLYAKMNPYWQVNDQYTGKFQKIVEYNALGNGNLTYVNPAYNSTLSTTDAMKYSRYSNLTNLNWLLGRGFQLDGMIGISKQSDELNHFLPPNHTAFASITAENLFTRGLYNYTSNSFFDVQGGLRLQYEQNFDKHYLFASIGQNLSQTSSESEAVSVSGFATDRLVDIALGNSYNIAKPVSGKIVTRYVSTFGNVGYSYNGRYQIDISGAMDYYSGLNQAANFGAVGVSWYINKEKFLKSVSWIDLLKIKGSLGISGNQNFLSYLNRTTYNYYTNQQYIPTGSSMGTIGIGLGAYLTGMANNQLQSPETFKQDLGLEASLLHNQLTFSLNVYKQISYRMILPVSSVASTGYQNFSFYDNYGEIENNGFELLAKATVYKSLHHNLKINVIANALRTTNKINAAGPYLNDVNNYNDFAVPQTTIQPKYVVGQPVYGIWAVPSLGIDAQSGQEIFLKKDGTSTTIWDAKDKVYAGSLVPTWVGALGTEINFKQFSFGAYFNYQYGAKAYNQTMADIENATVDYNLDARLFNSGRWSPGMPNAAYKGLFVSPTYATTRLVENENKLQCSSLTLGYMLPKTFSQRINAKNIGVKVMVNNAFEIGGADMQRGINYPFQRNYTFILNANF